MGAGGVEIDVHCLDGEIIVIHDSRLNRTTNGFGPLRRHTLAQVRLSRVLALVNLYKALGGGWTAQSVAPPDTPIFNGVL